VREKTPFDEGERIAREHGWAIEQSATKVVVVNGHRTDVLVVEAKLARMPSTEALSNPELDTRLIGEGRSIPEAVRVALGLGRGSE